MPRGLGGWHVGAESMLLVLGEVFAAYDVRIEVEGRLLIGEERASFTSYYVGTARRYR